MCNVWLYQWQKSFSQERKEDAIIAVLESSRSKTEFWKIVDGVQSLNKEYNRDNVSISNLLDFSQQERFNQLKIENSY